MALAAGPREAGLLLLLLLLLLLRLLLRLRLPELHRFAPWSGLLGLELRRLDFRPCCVLVCLISHADALLKGGLRKGGGSRMVSRNDSTFGIFSTAHERLTADHRHLDFQSR